MRNISFVVILLLLISCNKKQINISELDLPATDIKFKIVVEGSIFSEYGLQFVKLSTPGDWENYGNEKPVSGAEVRIFDGINYYAFNESEKPGEYLTIDSIIGEIGKVYTLTVIYNGEEYTATDSMVAVERMTENELLPINEIRKFNDHIEFYSYKHTFGFSKSNRWIFNEGSRDSLDNANIKKLKPYDIANFWMYLNTHQGAPPQGLFPNGFSNTGGAGKANDSVEFIKISVSDKYYNYLLSVFNETDWSSGLFSTIPGNVKTNVSKGGTGFFYASDIDKKRFSYGDLKALE